MSKNLQAEIRQIVPVASIQIVNGEWADEWTGKAKSRIWASIDRRQRAVCIVSQSTAGDEQRSGGLGAQLEILSSGLNASSENCL